MKRFSLFAVLVLLVSTLAIAQNNPKLGTGVPSPIQPDLRAAAAEDAQTVHASTSDVVPVPSTTEQLALAHIRQEFDQATQATKDAQQHLSAFKEDFIKAHPGWHFDALAGIVKDKPKQK